MDWLSALSFGGRQEQEPAEAQAPEEPQWSPWDLSSTNPHVANEEELHHHHQSRMQAGEGDDDSSSSSGDSKSSRSITTSRSSVPSGAASSSHRTTTQQSTMESVRKVQQWEKRIKQQNPELWKRHEDRCRRRFDQVQKHGMAGQVPTFQMTKGSGAMEHAATCRCMSCRTSLDMTINAKTQECINLHLTPERVKNKGSTFQKHFEAYCQLHEIQSRVIFKRADHLLYEAFRP
jgi:hypothetical protein